jgi:RNA polymerase sigma factor (sigma-70 family)
MVTSNIKNSAEQNCALHAEKELQTTTQPPVKKDAGCRKEPKTKVLAAEIRKAQDGDTKATMRLTCKFAPLLEREAARMTEQSLYSEKEDAKSEAVLNFLEFIYSFDDFDADDNRIAGLIKKYLHDIRINQAKAAEKHCPDCYCVDFERELEENSPFSKSFPCCEMQADDKLERAFRRTALLEAMQILTRKEETIVKKYFIENKPPSLIAKELHCSTRYLRKAKQRALVKMRFYLEQHYPGLRAM